VKAIFENYVFKRQTQALCIGIFLVNRNEWLFSAILGRIHNNEINIVSAVENLKELKEAGDMIRPGIPVILHIDGWGVLIKDNEIENSSIPVDNKEFFLKEYPKSDGSGSYFSIIRNDLLKSLVDLCSAASLNIIGLSMGPFNIALLSQFFEERTVIKAGKWKLTLNNGCVNSLLAEGIEAESIHDIGGDKISSGLLPLYASIIAFFSGERENNILIAKSREEFFYGRLVKYLSIASLSTILLLLLLNFFIWDSLRSRNTELNYEVTRNEQFLSQLAEKEKDIKMKENLVLQYIGANSKTHYSWYADKLGSTLPPGIRLTLLSIQPLIKKQKTGIAIEYKNRQIDVEGDARNMSEISDWVKAIDHEKWAKKVELISFSTDNDQSTGHFKLQIKY
jgi:Tfp pilus assembly protein PilN